MDLVISYVLWISLIALRPFERKLQLEIDAGTLEASHFTVVILQKPYSDPLEALPGIYWAWAENILEMEPIEFRDPMTNMVDENQNTVLSVNLGLANYGYLHIMQQMGKLLVSKKKL